MPTTQRHYPDVPAEATCGFGMDPRTLMRRAGGATFYRWSRASGALCRSWRFYDIKASQRACCFLLPTSLHRPDMRVTHCTAAVVRLFVTH